MFRVAEPYKGVVIDADSFPLESIEKWKELQSRYTCCFFVSSERTETINAIRKSFGELALIQTYHPFQRYFVPNILTHQASGQLLRLQTSQMVYVSRDLDYLINAMSFLSGTVWITDRVKYEDAGKAPDYVCRSIESFIESTLSGVCGYLGECVVSPLENSGGIVMPTALICDNMEIPLYVLGRYFGKKKYMNQLHPYSAALFYNKREGKNYSGSFDSVFADLYCAVIKAIMKNTQIDAVCAVPARPSGKNRFGKVLERISSECNTENADGWVRCVRDYPLQKSLDGAEREENVSGAFECTTNLDKKKIILIDDIITTGATVRECIRTIIKGGASKVFCIALAINQNGGAYWTSDTPKICCPRCGNEMLLLPNNTREFYYFCYTCKESNGFADRFSRLISGINKKDFDG